MICAFSYQLSTAATDNTKQIESEIESEHNVKGTYGSTKHLLNNTYPVQVLLKEFN